MDYVAKYSSIESTNSFLSLKHIFDRPLPATSPLKQLLHLSAINNNCHSIQETVLAEKKIHLLDRLNIFVPKKSLLKKPQKH